MLSFSEIKSGSLGCGEVVTTLGGVIGGKLHSPLEANAYRNNCQNSNSIALLLCRLPNAQILETEDTHAALSSMWMPRDQGLRTKDLLRLQPPGDPFDLMADGQLARAHDLRR